MEEREDDFKEEMFPCSCHSECIVAVRYWNEGPFVDLAFWQMGRNRKRTWRMKLRHIVRTIRDGSPYEDFVTLSSEDAYRLATFLLTLQGWEVHPRLPVNGSSTSNNITFENR